MVLESDGYKCQAFTITNELSVIVTKCTSHRTSPPDVVTPQGILGNVYKQNEVTIRYDMTCIGEMQPGINKTSA